MFARFGLMPALCEALLQDAAAAVFGCALQPLVAYVKLQIPPTPLVARWIRLLC
jgi:hypothetical protein